jgi:hypothetical protein
VAGFCTVELFGVPPGKTHEYLAALELVPKETESPAWIVTSELGVVMVPFGGVVV